MNPFLVVNICSSTLGGYLVMYVPLCRYQWIRRKGKPAPREMAPIVVSNHVSYIEPIVYFYELFPTMVASESHDSIPFVGTIIRSMQVITYYSAKPTCASSGGFS